MKTEDKTPLQNLVQFFVDLGYTITEAADFSVAMLKMRNENPERLQNILNCR